MNVLLLALTLAATVVAADRREIVGTLTIGADTYTVAGTIAEDGAKETKLSLILSHPWWCLLSYSRRRRGTDT
jgi:hypothetical protein